ncbi:leucine/isoleucine/valine transporter permease subunit [compost metagenome]
MKSLSRWQQGAALILLLALLAYLPLVMPPFYVRVAMSIALMAGFAVCWYILGGFAAYFSFGHTAFIGIGAFAAALACQLWRPAHWAAQLGVGLFAATLASAAVAAVIAWPILRLRGHYFTIAMLAVALVCAEMASAIPAFQGAIGLGLPNIAPMSMRIEVFFFWLALAGLVIAYASAVAIAKSRMGYGLFAIREDEDAAQMLGVPTTRYKVQAFVVSAALTGLLGAVFAWNLGYITTDSVFRGSLSLEMIVICLVGGLGSLLGPLFGAVILMVITKLLLSNMLEFHLAFTGLIIVLMVLYAPDGLVGYFERRRNARRVRAQEATQ